jgi:hypothetical protein
VYDKTVSEGSWIGKRKGAHLANGKSEIIGAAGRTDGVRYRAVLQKKGARGNGNCLSDIAAMGTAANERAVHLNEEVRILKASKRDIYVDRTVRVRFADL